jgi:hypothetical protein
LRMQRRKISGWTAQRRNSGWNSSILRMESPSLYEH